MAGCRKVVQERVLNEMLGGIQDSTGGGWKVLILDSTTTRILSSAMRMSDILEAGVSVVEDIDKRREPLPLAAVYFISPCSSSVAQLVADFETKPLYPSVHVFFSSGVTQEAVDRIKRCRVLLPLLKTLKEVNMEFNIIDGRTFITGHPHALIRCMGERAEAVQQECEAELDSIAARLCTALTTMHDYPAIRFRVGKQPEAGDAPGASVRSSLTQRLAQKLSHRATLLQRNGALPARESCDLLVLDRSVDPVAPVIHEWTYEALVYDLLSLDDNIIRYKAETAAGASEVKDHVLDDATDDLWAELRHAHIADVYTTLSKRFNDFQDKNKAAQYQRGAAGGKGVGAGNIKALIQALPQFRDVLGRLSVHIFISSELKNAINGRLLTEVGELEQNLVYGDMGSTELIKFLQDHGEDLAPVDKMRLFMSYLATHPEKLDPTKKQQWAKLARLDAQDMDTVCNLAYLNVAVMKQPGSQASKGLSFGLRGPRKKKATYRKRDGNEQYTLARFDPVLLDVMEDALAGKLNQDEYPYVRAPGAEAGGDDFGLGDPASRVASARVNRSGVFGLRRGSEATQTSGPSGVYSQMSSAMAGLGLGGGGGGGGGRKLLIFVVGGVTRSEMRAVHELSRRTGREIVLGSTAVLKPTGFLSQLRSIGHMPA